VLNAWDRRDNTNKQMTTCSRQTYQTSSRFLKSLLGKGELESYLVFVVGVFVVGSSGCESSSFLVVPEYSSWQTWALWVPVVVARVVVLGSCPTGTISEPVVNTATTISGKLKNTDRVRSYVGVITGVYPSQTLFHSSSYQLPRVMRWNCTHAAHPR